MLMFPLKGTTRYLYYNVTIQVRIWARGITMAFTTGGKTTRFIEHTPKKWAEFVRTRSPITESIVPLNSKGNGIRWISMSDEWLIKYAQHIVKAHGIENRKGVLNVDSRLYGILGRRKLIDRIKFKADERKWSRYSDDELVDYAQKFVDGKEIKDSTRFVRADGGLYTALVSRKLIGRVEFEGGLRSWSGYSDAELVEFAQGFVDVNEIRDRKRLQAADGGLCTVLRKRNLLDEIKFPDDERSWRLYSDDGLVEYTQTYLRENNVESRKGLLKKNRRLYSALIRRKLIGRVKFKADERLWSRYLDEELVAYAQRFVDKNSIVFGSELRKLDNGLYGALIRRNLIGKVRFGGDERAWRKYSDDELVEYSKKYIQEQKIRGRRALQKKDSGLYGALINRGLVDRAFSSLEQNQDVQGIQELAEAMHDFGGEECD